ncbi:alcohol dehydrogenase catalytic domain-containing protein [Streptomyces sp. NPDC047841]|uniref:zinc-dependent alcohol dehydrogenase n=1 Tax=Streptomyces sp. NPDC047841 TaxID=3154708 RepID=UPI003453824F
MTAAVLVTRPGEHRLIARADVSPSAGQALVRVHSNGICQSDADLLRGARPQGLVRYPVTPGHEWSGTVERIGDGVSADLLGRKVVGESLRSCRVCEPCHADRGTLCDEGYEEAGFTQPGGMAETLVVPAHSLHVLPDHADLASAALLEPAALAVAVVLTAKARPGESVAVLGDGVLGLLITHFLTTAGVRQVTVVGSRAERSNMAHAFGTTAYAPFGEPLPGPCDVAIHTVDARVTSSQMLSVLREGGRLICTSASPSPESLDVFTLVRRQIEIQPVLGAPSTAWSLAVRAFAEGRLETHPLITHTFSLDAYEQALDLMTSGRPGVGKVLLSPGA